MAVRSLRGERARLALTVVALALGVALVTAIDLANRAVFAAFSESVEVMAGRTSFVVAAGDGALFPEGVATTVGAITGVEVAVPVVSATAYLTDGSGEQLAVH